MNGPLNLSESLFADIVENPRCYIKSSVDKTSIPTNLQDGLKWINQVLLGQTDHAPSLIFKH